MKYNKSIDYLSHYFPFGVCLVSSKMRVTEPPSQKANRNNIGEGAAHPFRAAGVNASKPTPLLVLVCRVRSSQKMLREQKDAYGISAPYSSI